VIGRRIPAIQALSQGRQWADHVAYGLTVGLVLRARDEPANAGLVKQPSTALLPSTVGASDRPSLANGCRSIGMQLDDVGGAAAFRWEQ
jgi:hypothetical protein